MTREILIRWGVQNGAGGVTVLNVDETLLVANQRTAIMAMLTANVPRMASSTVWTVATEGREFNPITGELVGAWQENSAKTGNGSQPGGAVSNEAQVLIRTQTDTVVDGRFLKGKIYIPGVAKLGLVNGEVDPVYAAGFASAAQTMAIAAGLLVWHRPRPGFPGSVENVVSTTVWNEFAVLRQRR